MLTRVIAVAIVGVVAFGTGIAFAGGDEEPRAVSESNAPEYVKIPTQSVAGAISDAAAGGLQSSMQGAETYAPGGQVDEVQQMHRRNPCRFLRRRLHWR